MTICHMVSPGVRPSGTRRGTRRGTDVMRCWVQNQNQNQSLYLCGFLSQISDRIRNDGHLRTPSAVGFGVER